MVPVFCVSVPPFVPPNTNTPLNMGCFVPRTGPPKEKLNSVFMGVNALFGGGFSKKLL